MVAKKWGLSFSAIQQAMSQKKEHSVVGGQYGKRKRSVTSKEKEEPARKSKHLKEKSPVTQSKEVKSEKDSTKEMEQGKGLSEVSSGDNLPGIPWTKSK